MNPDDVIFTECARCGKFAVLPDEWVDLCPTCIFFQELPIPDSDDPYWDVKGDDEAAHTKW